MKNALWSIGKSDLINSIFVAIFAGVLVVLAGVFQQPGFNVFEADWNAIIKSLINVSLISFVASLSKAFSSDRNDHFLGHL